MLEAVEKGQMDFGFGVPIGLQLLWQQPNLLSQPGYGFGSLCPGDLYIAEGYRKMERPIISVQKLTNKSLSDAYSAETKMQSFSYLGTGESG